MTYFLGHERIAISLLAANKPDALALKRAERFQVLTYVFDKAQLTKGVVTEYLLAQEIDYIVLAGFLWLVPQGLIEQYPERIINIHPGLLPQYGGKGMYGHHVHEAVLSAGERESGVTIHLVNEVYDDGKHLQQATCPVLPTDTTESLAARVLQIEHALYPPTVEAYIASHEAWMP